MRQGSHKCSLPVSTQSHDFSVNPTWKQIKMEWVGNVHSTFLQLFFPNLRKSVYTFLSSIIPTHSPPKFCATELFGWFSTQWSHSMLPSPSLSLPPPSLPPPPLSHYLWFYLYLFSFFAHVINGSNILWNFLLYLIYPLFFNSLSSRLPNDFLKTTPSSNLAFSFFMCFLSLSLFFYFSIHISSLP